MRTMPRRRAQVTTSRLWALGALLISVAALAACGESSQDKANTDVCAAQSEISKQVAKLQGLALSSNTVDEAKSSLEAIGKELHKIKDAQSKLAPEREQQVEAANKKFGEQIKTIAAGVASSLSAGSASSALSGAESKLKSALSTLAAEYKQALAPLSCS